MSRKTRVAIPAAVAALAFTGCTDFKSASVRQSAAGEIAFLAEIGQSGGADERFTGTADLLFAIRVPDGTTTPAEFAPRGEGTPTFRPSPSYTAWLDANRPGPAGTEWHGYLSDDVDVDDPEATYTIDIPQLGLAQPAPSSVEVVAITGARTGGATSDDVVSCDNGSLEQDCAGDTFTDTVELVGPPLSIDAPLRTVYTAGEVVTADFTCDGTAVSCTGQMLSGEPIADGDPLPTGAVGDYALVVTATDGWGSTRTAEVAYRVVDSALTVTTASDAGDGTCDATCTLREAIATANAGGTERVIRFAIPGDGPHVLSLATPLPQITTPVTLDGYSQPGARRASQYEAASLSVELRNDGTDGAAGLDVDAAGSVIQGVAVNGFTRQVSLKGDGTRLAGSFIGLEADGDLAAAPGLHGVFAGDDTLVGDEDGTPAERNVVSVANVGIEALDATVAGNRVGIDPLGHEVRGAPARPIYLHTGGVARGNLVVPGENAAGIRLGPDGEAYDNTVGRSVGGEPLGVGNDSTGIVAEGNEAAIGAPGAGNHITAPRGIMVKADGVTVRGNDLRGRDGHAGAHGIDVESGVDNTLWSNTISGFGGLAIDLGDDNVPMTDDEGDADAFTNRPTIVAAEDLPGGGSYVTVSMSDAAPNTKYDVEVYANRTPAGQAERRLAQALLTTDADGEAGPQQIGVDVPIRNGYLRATATRTDTFATSELSEPVAEGLEPEITGVTFQGGATTGPEDRPNEILITTRNASADLVTYAIDCDMDDVYDEIATSRDDMLPLPCTFPDPGLVNIRARATDDDGEDFHAVVLTVAADPASVKLHGPAHADEGSTATYTWESTPSEPSEVVEDCGDGATYVDTDAPGSFDCTFGNGPGATTPSVTIKDQPDDVADDALAVTIGEVAPTLSITGPPLVGQGEEHEYTWTTTDTDTLTVTAGCGPGNTMLDSPDDGAFTCRFATVGQTGILVRLDDGTTYTQREYVVGVENVAPSVTVNGNAAPKQGATETYTYDAVDPGGDPLGTPTETCGERGIYVPDDTANSFGCRFPSFGPDTVSVTVGDGLLEGTGTLAIMIANQPPTASLSGPATVDQGETATYTWTAADPGSDPLEIAEDCGDGAVLVDTPAAGSFDCTFLSRAGSTVSVAADDGHDELGEDALDVAVTNVGPSAGDDAYATAHATPLTVATPGLLGNDADAGDDALVALAGTEPANGSLVRSADGSFTYTPNAGFTGTDTFTYAAGDGLLASAPATVTIAVGAPDAPPPPPPAPVLPGVPAVPVVPSVPVVPTPSTTPPGFGSGSGPANVRLRSITVSRTGVATLKLENRNAFAVRTRAVIRSVARKPRQLGARSGIALGAGKVATTTVRLDKRTRAALRRGSRVRATVSLAVADAAGVTRSLGVRATLRAPKRKG